MLCLNQIPFSTLKIDKSLIDHICEEKGKTLVEQVIMLSRLLNMKVVAEGVETAAEMRTVIDLGADLLQGYFLARPAAVPDPIAPEAAEIIRAI